MASHRYIDNPDRQIDRQHRFFLLTSIYIGEQANRPLILRFRFLLRWRRPLDKLSYFVKEPKDMTELTGMPTTISGQPRTEMNMNPHYKPQEGQPGTSKNGVLRVPLRQHTNLVQQQVQQSEQTNANNDQHPPTK
jgi:hypothetical protein